MSNALFYFKKTSTQRAVSGERKVALINLDKRIMNQANGRFSFILCKYFENAGFKVVIKTDLYYFLILHSYKKLLLEPDYVFVRRMPTPQDSFVIEQPGKKQLIGLPMNCRTNNRKQLTQLPFQCIPYR